MDEVVAIDGCGFGLLTRASGGGRSPVVLVLLNAGLTHRVGPFRMYVQLARHLAAQGIDVFRFDLPRVGDGPAEGVGVDGMMEAVLDALERATGKRRFAIGGVCSAADMAWRIAQDERRIAGLWLFDGFARRGRRFYFARARRALARPLRQWPGVALRLARSIGPRGAVPDIALIRDWPRPEEFARQASALLARGVSILAMYTGGVSKYLLHKGQLEATFGGVHDHPGLRLEFWPELDHTLLLPGDRGRVLASLAAWCGTLGAAAGAVSRVEAAPREGGYSSSSAAVR